MPARHKTACSSFALGAGEVHNQSWSRQQSTVATSDAAGGMLSAGAECMRLYSEPQHGQAQQKQAHLQWGEDAEDGNAVGCLHSHSFWMLHQGRKQWRQALEGQSQPCSV